MKSVEMSVRLFTYLKIRLVAGQIDGYQYLSWWFLVWRPTGTEHLTSFSAELRRIRAVRGEASQLVHVQLPASVLGRLTVLIKL